MKNQYQKLHHVLYFIALSALSSGLSAQTLEIERFVAGGQATGDFIWDIEFDKEGKLWACTEQGDLFYLDNEKWTTVAVPDIGSGDLRQMAFDSNNDLWLATDGFGIYHYDGTEWEQFTSTNSNLTSNVYTSLAIDKNDIVWAGSRFSPAGLSKYNGNNWIVYNESNSGLVENWISDIEIDENGTALWVAFDDYEFNRLNGQSWTTYSILEEFENTSVAILDLQLDSLGKLWIGTRGSGILAYDHGDWIDYRDDLGNRKVGKMAIDTTGNIWFYEQFMGLRQFVGEKDLYTYDDIDTIPNQIFDIIVDSLDYKYMMGNYGSYIFKFKEQVVSSATVLSKEDFPVSISPQPSTTNIRVKFHYDDARKVNYAISDLSGKSILTDEYFSANGMYDMDIDISSLQSGLLILSMYDESKLIFSKKIVKQ